MSRSREQSITSLVWTLVTLGLVAIVITNLFLGWTLSDLNEERQQLLEQDARLSQTSQQLRRLSQQAQNSIAGLLQFDPDEQLIPYPAVDFARLQDHFLLSDKSSEMSGIVTLIGAATGELQQLWQQASDWRSRQQRIVADQREKRTLSEVRRHLNTLRDTLESLEGQQRLSDALLLRRWRQARGSEAAELAQTLLKRQATLWKRVLNEVKIELMDLARMVESLAGEPQFEQLSDLKDNQLKPSLERIEKQLAILYHERLLDPQRLAPEVLEQLKEALFGSGYAIYTEYQTIRPGSGGLYQLTRNRLLQLRERERLQAEVRSAFLQLEAIQPDLANLTRQRSRSLAQQAADSLGRNTGNLLLISVLTLLGFLTLGRKFSLLARRQVAELEERDRKLQELNRSLEEKVAERTALLEEKSLQLIRTQEELLRQEKLAAIGSLASGVAHEINNPAAIIRGNVEILQMGLAQEAPEQEELREIMKQVERVSLITQNMLSFAGRQELHQEQVEISALLKDILAQVSHQVPVDKVQIELQLTAALPSVPGDRERLRQVFTNIILNALQALNGCGTLQIGGDLQQDQLRVSIRDSGPGIPQPLREKIFNPFFTTKRQGTGLGLSVSYGIIQAHGGTIELRTPAAGGAEFLISLPLNAEQVSPA